MWEGRKVYRRGQVRGRGGGRYVGGNWEGQAEGSRYVGAGMWKGTGRGRHVGGELGEATGRGR